MNYLDGIGFVGDQLEHKNVYTAKGIGSSFYAFGTFNHQVDRVGNRRNSPISSPWIEEDSIESTFIINYDSSGNELWRVDNAPICDESCGEESWEFAPSSRTSKSLEVLPNGNITVEEIYTYEIGIQGLVTNRDASGGLIWEKSIPLISRQGEAHLYGSTSDIKGNHFIIGRTDIDLNGQQNNSHNSRTDGFIVKLDPIGNIEWTRLIGSYAEDKITNATTDQQGNVYVVGSADMTQRLYLTKKSPKPGTLSPNTAAMAVAMELDPQDLLILKLEYKYFPGQSWKCLSGQI